MFSFTETTVQRARFVLTVPAHEQAVTYRHGLFHGVLEPGRHRVGRRTSYQRVDMRARRTLLAPQEVPTVDGALVKVTASIGWIVNDPRAFVENAIDPAAEVYLAVQVAIRTALSGREIEDLAAAPRLDPAIAEAVEDAARAAGTPLGIRVLDTTVKDIILPAQWRQAVLAVKTATLDGRAQLERARAETAALRALANQAQLLEKHPELAKLQLMKAAAASGVLQLNYQPFE